MRKTLWILLIGFTACSQPNKNTETVKPKYITEVVNYDSDDPAIWLNKKDLSKSMIYGTDKQELDGGLYAFSLDGKIDSSKSYYPLDRPNNVDIAYDFILMDDTIDVAICTERGKAQIRVFKLPELTPIDNGGIPVFADDSLHNQVMGVALYTRPSDSALFVIVSRKELDITDGYLYQYKIYSDSTGLQSELVRKFGKFSGTKEIEAIAVDQELGYVYYSDEHYGIHKYYADPKMGDEELTVFGLDGFTDDREGISIYKTGKETGYLLVSDQGAHQFKVFPREGTTENPHNHPEIAKISVTAVSSDGSEVTSLNLGPDFPEGLFVAMSDNRTFEIYDWRDLKKVIAPK